MPESWRIPNGTGLGLSISYGIIQAHQWTIEVRSGQGRGTTFVLTFPLPLTGRARRPAAGLAAAFSCAAGSAAASPRSSGPVIWGRRASSEDAATQEKPVSGG